MRDQSPQAPRVAVITDACFAAHTPPGFHPERPERLAAALRGVDAAGVTRVDLPARDATLAELSRVHDAGYLASLERTLARGQGYLDADTYFSPGTRVAAWRAAGGACALVDALVDGVTEVGALLARPPGHHAMPDRAMGFCLLNNVAIAAAHARHRGLARVAIVDWDVHHGNGTQAMFEADSSVMFVSLHQAAIYPGSGAPTEVGTGAGRGATLNVPLPAGSGRAAYVAAFERAVLPILGAFAPELVLISAGYDAHERDPLGSMRLDTDTYGWMAARLRDVARASGSGRVGLLLEGGYDLRAIEEGIASALRGLVAPAEAHAPTGPPTGDVELALEAVRAAQRAYWPRALG